MVWEAIPVIYLSALAHSLSLAAASTPPFALAPVLALTSVLTPPVYAALAVSAELDLPPVQLFLHLFLLPLLFLLLLYLLLFLILQFLSHIRLLCLLKF